MQSKSELDFDSLQESLLKVSSELTNLIIIFPTWSSEREKFLQNLHRNHLQITAFVIEEARSEENPFSLPTGVYSLRPQFIEADLAKALPHLS